MENEFQPIKFNCSDYIIEYRTDLSWKMDHYHFHDMFEIYFSLSNDAKFFVGNAIYEVFRGSLFVFNDMDLHRSIATENQTYKRYVLHFNPKYINNLCAPDSILLNCFINRDHDFSHCIRLSPDQFGKFIPLIEKGLYYQDNEVYGQEIYRKISLAEILLFVNQFFKSSTIVYPSKTNKDFEKILPVIKFIQSNLANNLSLDLIADQFFINKYYLESLFKKATGFSVIEYVIDRRILKARELLKLNIPVHQVGEMVGFNNTSHFIRTFKNKVGLPPKKYTNQSFNKKQFDILKK